MRVVYFTHSLASCWNHGNAHFLRGVLRELLRRGHDVIAYEPAGGWSRTNLRRDHGENSFRAFAAAYPDLAPRACEFDWSDGVGELVAGAELVIVHEWNDPRLVAALGRERLRSRDFTLLFHDTHHRGVSDPAAIRALDLDAYDGVLAFGAALADVYRRLGWGERAYVWHEAADVSLFRPPPEEHERHGLVWIGNWGDGERTRELEQLLLAPARDAGLPLDIYGVRYPQEALALLARYDAAHRGWLPNVRAPDVFAQHLATVHVPRRFYAEALPGIPTIRVFEALACGIPLLCAPWEDCEKLFRPGVDYLVAQDLPQMARLMRALAVDRELRSELVRNGLATVRARHTCAHRVDELLTIVARIKQREPLGMPA